MGNKQAGAAQPYGSHDRDSIMHWLTGRVPRVYGNPCPLLGRSQSTVFCVMDSKLTWCPAWNATMADLTRARTTIHTFGSYL